jgi:hypothetical protein
MNWLLRGLLHHVYMAEEGAGAAGGGSATTGAEGQGQGDAGQSAAAGGGEQGGQSSAGAESGAGDKTVLAGAQSEPAQAAQIQEKYLVKNEDGSINWEQSALKQAQGFESLTKRLGSGDAPPKSADDYQINVPDNLKEALGDDFKDDPLLKDFLKDAHAAGMSQKQVDIAINKYLQAIPELAGGVQQLSADECVAALKETWKTDGEYQAGVQSAFKAAQGFFGEDAQHIIDKYGNDPILIRGLAKIGAEMGEDKAVSPESALTGGQSVDELMRSQAYNDPKHADHAKVSKQVSEYFARLAKQQEKAGTAPIM